MSETKQESNLSLIWELVLYIILIFSIVGLPFLNGHYYSYSDTSQVFLFRKTNSVFWGQEFKGVVNSYFIISLILLIILPVIAYFIHDSFHDCRSPFPYIPCTFRTAQNCCTPGQIRDVPQDVPGYLS